MEDTKAGTRGSWFTILINAVLCFFKILAGVLGRSSAMIADGVHTLSDVITTLVVIVGLKVSGKEADKKHPYGHEKFEAVFAKIVSLMLILTGLFIFYEVIKSFGHGNFYKPGRIAIYAAVVSIAAQEFMYHYTIAIARKIKSLSMEADAWHHRSDALSSIGTLIGVLGARAGITILDPIAALLVSILIIKVGVEYYIKAVKELVDEAADEELENSIREITETVQGVEEIYNIKTRVFGNKVYADIQVLVDKKLSVEEGHRIARAVHDKIEEKHSSIKHCMIYIKPYVKSEDISNSSVASQA
jgi:cation diffusion facilitator family transporter